MALRIGLVQSSFGLMERPGFEPPVCHFLAGYLGANHLTLLRLREITSSFSSVKWEGTSDPANLQRVL